ncbi:TRAP transporter small permease, partial [Aeromonas veronii]|nr:TRAP transporter small permease [Aeromonas veronii]
MKKRSLLSYIEKICISCGCFILIIIMLLTSFDTITRYFFNTPIPGVNGIVSEYLMPYVVYLTLGYVFSKGGHVRVTLLIEKFPLYLNKAIMRFFDLLTIILFLLIGYGGLKRTISAAEVNEFSANIISYPLAPAYFSAVIGSIILIIYVTKAILSG